MELFKVLSLEEYEKCMSYETPTLLVSEIKKIPKAAQRKVKKFIELLSKEGLTWNESGVVENPPQPFTSHFSILPFVNYATRGKDRPHEWSLFASYLSQFKIPKDLLSLKASAEIRKAKRNEKEKD